MKRLSSIKGLSVALLCLLAFSLSFTPIMAQAPFEPVSAVLLGPVWTGEAGSDKIFDNFAVHIGYAHKSLADTWIAGSAEWGSRAEVQLEFIRLFGVSERLAVGVSAGGGLNYSDSGLTIAEMVFWSGGLVGTIDLNDEVGFWLIYESRYEEKPKFGFGVYHQI